MSGDCQLHGVDVHAPIRLQKFGISRPNKFMLLVERCHWKLRSIPCSHRILEWNSIVLRLRNECSLSLCYLHLIQIIRYHCVVSFILCITCFSLMFILLFLALHNIIIIIIITIIKKQAAGLYSIHTLHSFCLYSCRHS